MCNAFRKPGLLIILAALSQGEAQIPSSRFPRQGTPQVDAGHLRYDLISGWRREVARHQPGEMDRAASEIEEWPNTDVETAIRQVKTLARTLAHAPTRIFKLPIQSLLGLTSEEMKTGNANRLLKRGALLHTDIAILGPQRVPEIPGQRARYLVKDGRVIGQKVDPHWEYARLLLDSIHPNPASDDMVLQWYRATSADMLNRRQWGTADDHLDRARKIFPSDPHILFYSGTLHEFYAGTFAQNTRNTSPAASRLGFGSRESELSRAQEFLQAAVKADPNFGEAHLRLGRVTGLLGNHAEAVVSLKRADAALSEPLLRYYAALFLGSEYEMLGGSEEAREQFESAAGVFPTAQSPRIALTRLMRWTKDYRETVTGLTSVLSVPGWGASREDPWWIYEVVQARDAEQLMAEMRSSIGSLPK